MKLRVLKVSALALASVASATMLSAGPAAAANQSVTFKFDQMGDGTTGHYNASGQDASSYQISNYMTRTLSHNSTYSNLVTVTGGIGQQGADSYVGDNHVVGPTETSGGRNPVTKVYPLTLANTNGLVNPSDTSKWDGATNTYANPPVLSNSNPDGFLKNCSSITSIDPVTTSATSKTGCYDPPGSANQGSPDIFIDFHGLKIFSFSFDFEIFPDGTCTKLNTAAGQTNCGTATTGNLNPNLPDLEIWSGDNGTGTHFGTFYGLVPGAVQNTVTCDSTTSTANPTTNPTYKKSGAEASTTYSTETAPQLLCHASYTVSDFTSNTITSLDFMDWPETIGIDNLTVLVGTPEPASIAFLVLGMVGLAGLARRRRARSARLLDGASQV